MKSKKIGLLIAGYGGSIGSTVTASLDLMSRGLRPKLGMICESSIEDEESWVKRLALPGLDEIIVSGWDLTNKTLDEFLRIHQVLQINDIESVSKAVLNKRPMLAERQLIEKADGKDFGSCIEKLRQDIKKFRLENQIDRVVVVNCISTQEIPNLSFNYDRLEDFRTACATNDPSITPSMKYACAAILESAAFVNFTPNIAMVPALVELAISQKVPVVGRDGKTGQTLFKTSLAPMFKSRGLLVKGWYSINILGNQDGETLSQEENCETKIKSKEACLEEILGYSVEDHQVHIHYYRPRGDNKEAWDNIDLEGFLGYPMQVKLNFLGRDSILAAPLIIDLARLIALAMRRGEYGLLPHLSMFFKTPEVPVSEKVEHDFFRQRELFENWIANCCE